MRNLLNASARAMARVAGLGVVLLPAVSVALNTQNMGTLTANDLVNALLGPGVTFSNAVFTGSGIAGGTFTGGASSIGFDSGIALGTGNIVYTNGPNLQTAISVSNNRAGDGDLSNLAGVTTYDAAVLEFDFVPQASQITFDFVFGSDEYPEFVGQFNDVFAFIVNGTNVALIPGTTTPVSINTVNMANNPVYYVDNTSGARFTEMDGLTTVLTAKAVVTPNATNHIKIAIADARDYAVDSNVFIRAGSFSVMSPNLVFHKSAPASAVVGTEVTFTLTVYNGGAGTATNVMVWDTLPPGTTFVSGTDGPGFDGTRVSWSLGPVNPGVTKTVSFRVFVTNGAGSQLVNDGALWWTGNTVTTSNTVTVNLQRPAMTIWKEAIPPGDACGGEAIKYRVSWRNDGNGTALNLTVTDSLPNGTAYSGFSTRLWAQTDWLGLPAMTSVARAPSSSGPWTSGEPPPGALSPLVLRWTVDRVAPGKSGFIEFSTVLSASLMDGMETGNAASATVLEDPSTYRTGGVVTVKKRTLAIVKTASSPMVPIGALLTYHVFVTNLCADVQQDLVVWDTVPPGVDVDSIGDGGSYDGTTVSWSLPSLGSYGVVDLDFTVSVTGVSSPVGPNLATVYYENSSSVAQPLLTSDPVTVVINRVILSTSLVVDASPAEKGETVRLRFTVTNRGGVAANSIVPFLDVNTGAGLLSPLTGPVPSSLASLAPGGSVQFTWTGVVASAGTASFTATATAIDSVTAGPVLSRSFGTLLTANPAALSSVLIAIPARASMGQSVTLAWTVTSTGAGDVAGFAPALGFLSGGALVSVADGPVPAGPSDIPGGTATIFSWALDTVSAGLVQIRAVGHGHNAVSGRNASATAYANLIIETPANLRARLSVRPSACPGQSFVVTLTVTNSGQAQALGVSPATLLAQGAGTVALADGPFPSTPVNIPGLAVRTWTWTFTGSTPVGAVAFTTTVTGTDANAGWALTTGPVGPANLAVGYPAALSAAITPPPVFSLGVAFTVTLTAVNAGDGPADRITPNMAVWPGSSLVQLAAPPGALVTVPAKGSADFPWTFSATGWGAVAFTSTLNGTDSCGTIGASAGAVMLLGWPAALAAAPNRPPTNACVGDTLAISLTVTNTGQVPVNGLAALTPVVGGSGAATQSGFTPFPVTTLQGGKAATASWSYLVTSGGTVVFSLTATGTDARSGAALSGTAYTSQVTAVTAAVLSGSASGPSSAIIGRWIETVLTVNNTGGQAANGVMPVARLGPGTGNANNSSPVPAVSPAGPVTIGASSSQAFTWTWSISGAGLVTFSLSATGVTCVNTPVSGFAAASLTALRPAQLVLEGPTLSPAGVQGGGTFSGSLTLRNTGDAALTVDALTLATEAGSISSFQPYSGLVPATLPTLNGGQSVQFTWSHATDNSKCGTARVEASVSGHEDATSRALACGPSLSNQVAVSGPAKDIALTAPARSELGRQVQVQGVVTDLCGLGVPGITVSFAVLGGGGSFSASSGVTDALGRVPVTYTVGTVPGPNLLEATYAAYSATALIDAYEAPNPLRLTEPGTALSTNVINLSKGEAVIARMWPKNKDPLKVRIFTASGKLVRILEQRERIGYSEQVMATWDGLTQDGFRVARGVYLVRVDGGGLSETLKVLVK